MENPVDLDSFLAKLLESNSGESAPYLALDDDQRAFVERILDAVTTGSKAVFVVLHPNDRMQYMLLNVNRAGAIPLLVNVIGRTGEALEADVE